MERAVNAYQEARAHGGEQRRWVVGSDNDRDGIETSCEPFPSP